MEYSWAICYPDKEEIENKGNIRKEEIFETFKNYPWEDQLRLMENLGEAAEYNPSIRFTHSNGYWLELTAHRNSDKSIGFSLWYNRLVTKKVLFGLFGEREAFSVIDNEFTFDKALDILQEYLYENYRMVNQKMKQA